MPSGAEHHLEIYSIKRHSVPVGRIGATYGSSDSSQRGR